MIEVGKTYKRNSFSNKTVVFITEGNAMIKDASGNFSTLEVDFMEKHYTEVKPKIKRKYWLVHSRSGRWLNAWTRDPHGHVDDVLAITGPHTVEFEEGEGLDA
jgi:hypothetical protein